MTQEVALITVDLKNRERITSTLKEKVDMDTGMMRMTITFVYYFPGIKMKIISCVRRDELEESKKKQGTCILLNRGNDTRFLNIKREESSGLFITRLLLKQTSISENAETTNTAEHCTSNKSNPSKQASNMCNQRLVRAERKPITAMFFSKTYETTLADKPCTQDWTIAILTSHIND